MPVANIIPFALPLPPILPTIEGNVDDRDLRDQLLRIDGLLIQSKLETQLLAADLQRWLAGQKHVSARASKTTSSMPGAPCAATSPGVCSKRTTAALPPI